MKFLMIEEELFFGVTSVGRMSGSAREIASEYSSTCSRKLMTPSESVAEKGGNGTCGARAADSGGLKRQSILSRQRSSVSFDMGAKKIDQVRLI